MALLNSKTADQAHDLIDYKVVDQTGADIGTLHALWADPQSGKLQFFGVKTGWLFGQNHVIPVERAEVNDADRTLTVPYTADFIKGAMSIDADSEISDEQEQEIYRYYQVGGRTSSMETTGTSFAQTGTTGTAYRTAETDLAAGGVAAGMADTGATEARTTATDTAARRPQVVTLLRCR